MKSDENYSIKLLLVPPAPPVVQLSWRKYPGLVIQGDTLQGLYSRVSESIDAVEAKDHKEAIEILKGVRDTLLSMVEAVWSDELRS